MRNFLRHLIALLFCVATVGAARQGFPDAPNRQVTVAPKVALHVVDWGGKGETLLFLSGLSNTAYAFDGFAPLFTDSYRTVGITRRGIPPSDSSRSGYNMDTLIHDIITVMDSLGISSAHIVGWSFGGNEAVLLAVAKPERVRSVILLDSYDNSPEAKTFAGSDTLKLPSSPFTPFDSTSALALMWRQKRLGNRPLPLRAIIAANRFSKEGRYIGRAISDNVIESIIEGASRLPYSSLAKPVLAIFATTRGVGDLSPRYWIMNDSDRVLIDLLYLANVRESEAARVRVRNEIAQVTVVEIPGASHAVFNSNPERVFLEMRKFLNQVRSSTR